MVDLFRPYVAPEAAGLVAQVFAPDVNGRTYLGQGPKVDAFERGLRVMLDADRDILTINSCTSALDLALHLCGVGPGDTVISTPMTCSATNSPIVTRGARVLWADVDPLTGLIDPEDVARKLLWVPETKAVLVVDWGGRMAPYNWLREVCRPHGVPIIEDAAHALLATYNGRYQTHVGGDYICWSFQAIKHLTTGDGGALLCPEEQLERARLLRWYGLDRTRGESFRCTQDITEVGYKWHMNDVAAAIGLANLPHLREVVYRHRQHAAEYHERLGELPGVTLPKRDMGSSWWLYTLLVEERDAFIAYMSDQGIACSPVHSPNHRHTAFRAATHPASGALPGVEQFADHEVAIPVGWWLTPADRWRIVAAVKSWALRGQQRNHHATTTVPNEARASEPTEAQETKAGQEAASKA